MIIVIIILLLTLLLYAMCEEGCGNDVRFEAANIRGLFDKYITKQHHSVSFPSRKKNLKYTFCRKFYFEDVQNFFRYDIIIVTLSAHRTQLIYVLFFPPVFQ